ncbi:hypothetical protein RF11_12376 [Thelohanellus kitauei]|uniref:Uncharacterized protein n=1 Tax=Thelohanellus kitauei TaxID=669202 RepID=A0A0C2NFW1_THEKT|nr:hypothetical protein RF11_12376 [Thelohanellus kitauei]
MTCLNSCLRICYVYYLPLSVDESIENEDRAPRVGLVSHLLFHLHELGILSEVIHIYQFTIQREYISFRTFKFDHIMTSDLKKRDRSWIYWIRSVELKDEICEFTNSKGPDISYFPTQNMETIEYIQPESTGKDHILWDMYQELQSFILNLTIVCSFARGKYMPLSSLFNLSKRIQIIYRRYYGHLQTLIEEFNRRFEGQRGYKDLLNFLHDTFSCKVESVQGITSIRGD